eukprot:Filipodium_phascolosomae@DN2588_c0_g1_i3.p1
MVLLISERSYDLTKRHIPRQLSTNLYISLTFFHHEVVLQTEKLLQTQQLNSLLVVFGVWCIRRKREQDLNRPSSNWRVYFTDSFTVLFCAMVHLLSLLLVSFPESFTPA